MQLQQLFRQPIIDLARARGYEIIPYWKMDEVPLVRHLRDLFEKYRIELVVDVGANMGQYHDLLREEVGFKGTILSFEPVKKYYDMLCKRADVDPQWRIFPCALGSAAGHAEINVTRSPGLNSFLAARTDVVEGYWASDALLGVETVEIRTLDRALSEAAINCAAMGVYVKLDTQGFDLEVIKGAELSLPFIRALQTEASLRPIYQGMPTYEETSATLSRCGFDISGMFPVTRDDHLRLIELDLVYINRRCI